MKTPWIRRSLAAVLACASLAGALAATTYTLTDLGTGGATDINNSGKVVGNASTGGWYFDGTARATLNFQAYYLGGPPENVEPVGGISPVAISDRGRIIGVLNRPGLPTQPFYYDGSGAGVVLGGSADEFNPHGVNSAGVVVGLHSYFDGTNVVNLPDNSPGTQGEGRAVNASGLIVGNFNPGSAFFKAATFANGTHSLLDMSSLDGFFTKGFISDALSVNSAGQIVGYVKDASFQPTPKTALGFLYADSTLTLLGGLGGLITQAKDISNSGVIVGTSMVADGTSHAVVFLAGGAAADLNGLVSTGGSGWVLTSANAVNDSGVIVGEGLKNGVAHAFRLDPSDNRFPPAISVHPVGGNAVIGEVFPLSVTASGAGSLTYQWQHAGTNLPGATASTYALVPASLAAAGDYQVLVSNAFGTTPSHVATVQVGTMQPLHLDYYAGLSVTGTVGQGFRIEAVEAAGDTHWQALGKVTLAAPSFLWADADSPQHPHRYYRAVLLP